MTERFRNIITRGNQVAGVAAQSAGCQSALGWTGLDCLLFCSLSGYSFPLARHYWSCLGDNGMFALFTYILLFSGIDVLPFLLIFPWHGLKSRSVCSGDPRVFGGFRTPLICAAAMLQGYPYPTMLFLALI